MFIDGKTTKVVKKMFSEKLGIVLNVHNGKLTLHTNRYKNLIYNLK